VRDVVLVGFGRHLLLPLEELIDLARAHVDTRDDVALTQDLQGDLLADALAVTRVVDALARERRRQVGELEIVGRGHVGERVVELLVGHLDARTVCPLHLQLLQHEAVQHLLAQDVGGWQIELLLTQPLGDDENLLVELARQDHTFVHRGGDAIEQHAGARRFAGLGRGAGGHQGGDEDAKRARKYFINHVVVFHRAELAGEYPRIVRSRKASAFPTLARPFSSSCR
jgi:hypothetical protein